MSSTDFARGNESFQKSDFRSAYRHYTNALKANPKNAVVLDCRAATNQRLGKHKDALEDARLIVKLEPTQARGYLRLYKVLTHLNQKDKAQQVIGVSLRRVPAFDKLYPALKRLKTSKDIDTPIQNYWPLLPLELIHSIFLSLPLQDRVRSMRVCRYWHQILRDTPAIWRDLTITNPSTRITFPAFTTYLKRAGSAGVHTIALGSISFKKQRGNEPMKDLLNAPQCLQHIDFTGWSASHSTAQSLLRQNKSTLRYVNATDATSSNDYICAAIEECDILETLVCLNYTRLDYNELKYPSRAASSVKNFHFKTQLPAAGGYTAGPMVRYIGSLPNLENLSLHYTDGIPGTFIHRLILSLPYLQQFRVRIEQRLSSALRTDTTNTLSAREAKELERNSANIRVFSLACLCFYDWELIPIITGCREKIQALTLYETSLTDHGLQHVCLQPLPQLQVLELSRCHFSSETMVSLLRACPNLRNVVLNDLPNANDEVMTALAQCKHVTTLDISSSTKITGFGVRRVVAGCPSLRRLVADCCSIDLDTIQHTRSVMGHSSCSFFSRV
ncbi:hypothetical protein K450DRAFT_237175 [Umbelopsis ramanniana AG]|uniref:F-box domain-containing protein n=1 Tax=Umbelopsis ramanniana AG TaxID=1314678 RepID=A0AAD5EDW4_UMBRA|nr:uncharacterized protein K450DRAFT_237175 [Umbelopsis ramanniana AG]KAI8580465.1 hypothetical protein K450DRAFT_237175 [Umbelopsis ramanniana AG]